MSSLEARFDLLPEEVLCMIFDLLRLEYVKNASLTCRRWNNIIFLGPYVKRFQFKIELSNQRNPTEDQSMYFKRRMQNVVDYVNHTKRCYRQLSLTLESIEPDYFQSIWECLHPKVTENIYSLKLSLYDVDSQDTIRLLAETVPLMPNLRSLSIPRCYFRYPADDQTIVLRSSSVQCVKLEERMKIEIDMPELESYEGPPGALRNQPLGFDKLKHVKVSEFYCNPCQFRNVETLIVYNLTDARFVEICNTCTALKELRIWHRIDIAYPDTLKQITKLSNLRRLSFRRIKRKGIDFCLDLSDLSQLEDVDLGETVFHYVKQIRLPKTIRYLRVRVTDTNQNELIQYITGSLTQLKKLWLLYGVDPNWRRGNRNGSVDKNKIKALHNLTQLKELTFEVARLYGWIFIDMDDLMHQLRVLRLWLCKHDGDGPVFPMVANLTIEEQTPWICQEDSCSEDSSEEYE
uniref:F-box domain-containing protein n=1 Tax=Anopheles marajoara TaxID=58244 RepID=A0A2M4BMF2_9DIPT